MPNLTQEVLITGCSSGIGYCVACGLRQRGYRVFATARKAEDVARLSAEGFESLLLDLDDSQSIHTAVSEILSLTGGRLYALFNNGAYGQPGAVEDLRRETLRAQLETNLLGWLDLTNLVIPVMRQQGFGRIIQNSSVLGLVSLPLRGAYNASKYALEGLSDTLRLELHGSNIFVSLIEPGPIESKFRINAYRHWYKIDIENSYFRARYENLQKRLQGSGPVLPFTLPPEAVLRKVIHALESKTPRPRYYVTVPTYLFGTLRRILSSRWLDKVMFYAAKGDKG